MPASRRSRNHPYITVFDDVPRARKRGQRRTSASCHITIDSAPLPAPPLVSEKVEPPERERNVPRRKQGSSDQLAAFLERRADVAEECLRHYGRASSTDSCTQCGQLCERLIRCRDCFETPELCTSCQLEIHRTNPLHWVERWDGRFFRRHSLCRMGMAIHLGHNGQPCPETVAGSGALFTIVHTNGIHDVRLHFCECFDAPERYVQLLRARLFPSTYEIPKTAFTFALLKDFHLHTLCSKKSAYDYYAKLVRQTSDVNPASTSDRYRELLRVSRIWIDLESLRRSGHLLQLESTVPSFAARAIRSPLCPACPQLGINVTEEEVAGVTPSKTHLFTLYLGGDGNFTLSSKRQVIDAHDVPLNNGMGFFPNQQHFDEYIREHEDIQLSQTCSGFRTSMLFQGNLGYRSSGVYSWSCLRHGFYRPRGTVDLQIGERFSNVDYAFANAVDGAEKLPRILLSYDLACMWQPKWRERMAARFPHLVPLYDRITFAVPKMHEYAHKESCRYLYSLSWLEGAGRVDGEGVERTWAEHNQLGGSTKEMNPGHRRDCLETHFSDWNWRKQRDIIRSLTRRMVAAQDEHRRHEKYFSDVSLAFGDERVSSWKRSPQYSTLGGGKFESVYRFPEESVPTCESILERLRKNDKQILSLDRSEESRSDVTSLCFVQLGITLQEAQFRVKEDVGESLNNERSSETELDPADVAQSRQALAHQIDRWRQLQLREMPLLSTDYTPPAADTDDDQRPELEELGLPSDFDPQARRSLQLDKLAALELELRKAQAEEAVTRMIEELKIQHAYRQTVRKGPSATGIKTRARKALDLQSTLIRRHADTYRRARDAMLALGLPQDDPKYRPLSGSDVTLLYGARQEMNGRTAGADPWFHILQRSSGNTPAASSRRVSWSDQVDSVTWWRARAADLRWKEEVQLLEEEMKRVIRFFDFYAKCWAQAGARQTLGRGRAAYAAKQQFVCGLLAEQARAAFAVFLDTPTI